MEQALDRGRVVRCTLVVDTTMLELGLLRAQVDLLRLGLAWVQASIRQLEVKQSLKCKELHP